MAAEAWLTLVLLFLVYESVALYRGKGTFTSHTKPTIQKVVWVKIAVFIFWLWLGYHYFIEV